MSISGRRLLEIYESGARLGHIKGLEAVWDAAQLDILGNPEEDRHPHPEPVVIRVPDRRLHAQLRLEHPTCP